MSGGIYNEDNVEGEEEEYLFEMMEDGGGGDGGDPLADFNADVDLYHWKSGRIRDPEGGRLKPISGKRTNETEEDNGHPKRNRVERCIFCLKTVIDKTEDFSSLFSTFNQIWGYLELKWEESENLIGFTERNAGKVRKSAFNKLPTMCQFCGDNLTSVDKLLKDLEMQIRKLWGVIQKSKSDEQFEKVLKDSRLDLKNEEANEHPNFRHSSDYQLAPQQLSSPVILLNESVDDFPVDTLEILKEENDPEDRSEHEHEDQSDPDSDPDYIKSEEDASSTTAQESFSEEEEPELESIPVTKPNTKEQALICDKCGKVLSTLKILRRHKQIVHAPGKKDALRYDNLKKIVDKNTGQASHICTMTGCGKRFRQRYEAMDHQRRTHKITGDLRVICDICGKTLADKKVLARHKKRVHEKQSMSTRRKCDLCGDFIPEQDLYRHLEQHVGEEYIIKCPFSKCLYAFTRMASLYHHLEQNKRCRNADTQEILTKKTYICEICGYTTGHAYHLRGHLLKNHESATKNYSCPISGCGQSFSVKQSVVLHLPHHDFSSGVTSQRCDLCSEQIKLDKMEEHLKDKHQVSEIIKCKQCSCLFSSREQLLEHLFEHRFGGVMCDICEDGDRYNLHADLRQHYFSVHKLGTKIPCELCGRCFWTKDNLRSHIQKCHKDVPEKKHRCEECGVEFKMEISLKDHNIRDHGAEPYSCTFCSEKFIERKSLAKHLNVHRGLANEFQCEVEGCGKIFNSKTLLRRHKESTHLGIKHVCEICGKSYARASGLITHKRVHSSGHPELSCDVCGESCGSGNALERHKLLHSRDRPFECEVCGQRFRFHRVLKRHLQGHEKKRNRV